MPEVSEAPSVGAVESAGSSEATPTSSASMSEDAILASVGEDASGEAPAVDTTSPVVEAKPAPTQEPEAKPEEDYSDPAIEQTLSEQRKAVFKQDRELRDSFYRDKAYQQVFPTVAEAREFKQLFPSLEYAKEAAGHSATLAHLDRLYAADPATFTQQLHVANPQAFRGMLQELRNTAYQADPDGFRESVAKPQVLDTLENLREIHAQDENVQAAVEILKQALGVNGPQPQVREDDPRLQELEQLKRSAYENQARAYNAFSSTVSTQYRDGLNKIITDAVGKPSGMSERAIERIRGEVFQAIQDELDADPRLVATYNYRLNSGRFDQEHQKAVVDFALAHARPRVAAKVGKAMTEWTRDILGVNQAVRDRAKATATTKDIGSGAPGRAPSGNGEISRDPRTGRFVNSKGRPLTEDEILDL